MVTEPVIKEGESLVDRLLAEAKRLWADWEATEVVIRPADISLREEDFHPAELSKVTLRVKECPFCHHRLISEEVIRSSAHWVDGRLVAERVWICQHGGCRRVFRPNGAERRPWRFKPSRRSRAGGKVIPLTGKK